jgi:hypothetical protein
MILNGPWPGLSGVASCDPGRPADYGTTITLTPTAS